MGSACGAHEVALRGDPDEEGVDRSNITRNKNGSEEPNSEKPELWNIDGTEMDWNAKYIMGKQMWYLQDRAKGNIRDNKPIAGYPINQRACRSGRKFKAD